MARPGSKDRIYFRVAHHGLMPADSYAAGQLREKNFNNGDIIQAQLSKLNNPKFNRLLHRIAQLCAANIETFSGMEPHRILKRIQLEGNIACDEIQGTLPGIGEVTWRIPESLSFDSMDDIDRHIFAQQLCQHIAMRYWPGLSAEQIEEMADSFVND